MLLSVLGCPPRKSMRLLQKQAQAGQRYLSALRREVVRLAMLADSALDGRVFAKAVGRLEEDELLELKGAYEAQVAKRFPVPVQLRQRQAELPEDAAVFQV